MSEDRSGRELAPREPGQVEATDSSVAPVPEGEQRDVERFSAGPRAHAVGLTEERSAQIVRQSANARNVVFLAVLIIAIFVPVYWFYEQGIPALGTEGRLASEADVQYVTDVSRGYELYIANCASCHSSQEDPGDGKGRVGPPLSAQAKLYNALTPDGQPGTGHLNPDYIENVLSVGGRYVCGDPNSIMQPWLQPNGPLNYRQVEELIAWMTASTDVRFEPRVESHGATEEAPAEPEIITGWRDPDWQPEPGATPPPACWKAPDGLVPAGTVTTPPAATPAPDGAATPPPATGGTPGSLVVTLDATADLKFKDDSGNIVPQIEVSAGQTVEFIIDNTAGFEHNFYIGPADVVSQPFAETPVGIPGWSSGEQTTTWTVEAGDVPLQFACTVPGHYAAGMHGDIVIQG